MKKKLILVSLSVLVSISANGSGTNSDKFVSALLQCFEKTSGQRLYVQPGHKKDFQITSHVDCKGEVAKNLYDSLVSLSDDLDFNSWGVDGYKTIAFGRDEISDSTPTGWLGSIDFQTSGSSCTRRKDGTHTCELDFKMTLNSDMRALILKHDQK